ncbi:MAG: sulfite exporter TauE/SafE family protein [Acidimicrobiales bacterium]
MSPVDVALGTLVMAVGACLQGVVGFGANLVAAPLLVLVDPVFVPAPVVLVSLLSNSLVARREGRGAVDERVRWAMVGYVPGVLVAGWAIAVLPTRGLSIGLAVCILVAVAVTAAGVSVTPTAGRYAGAGSVSGVMGTIAGVGGPPLALLMQRAEAPAMRGTLAVFFRLGSVLSLLVLVVVGELGRAELVAAAALAPGVLAGTAASAGLARRVGRRSLRPVVLGLSGAAAVAVLARELL